MTDAQKQQLVLRWSWEAVEDLQAIRAYIEEDSLDAALRVITSIHKSCEALPEFPRKGRIGKDPRTRELVLNPLPYILIYEVHEEIVRILHICHGAQNWRH